MAALSDPRAVRELLARHDFSFSKALGQNFLINPSVCPRMAAHAAEGGAAGVIEIGPGIGVLTRELSCCFQKVVSFEVDTRLAPILSETLSECDNVTVRYTDILEADLQHVLQKDFAGMDVCVCANLPYYITSPILMYLLEGRFPLESITVMVQKEAAERICALPGTRQCGAVTAAVHYYAVPEKLFSVSRGSFLPAPQVDSAVMRLTVRKTPPVTVQNEDFLFRVIRAAFAQRRKTAVNSLSAGLSLPKPVVGQALSDCGLPATIRAENCTLQDFAAISDRLFKEVEQQ